MTYITMLEEKLKEKETQIGNLETKIKILEGEN